MPTPSQQLYTSHIYMYTPYIYKLCTSVAAKFPWLVMSSTLRAVMDPRWYSMMDGSYSDSFSNIFSDGPALLHHPSST